MKNKRKKINWVALIVCFAVVFLVGFIGSLFTSPNTSTEWYEEIKPAITPPNFVFPIVWNILFFLIALSLYFAWKSSNKNQKPKIVFAFGINFILNIFWSILFFGLKNPLASFIELIFLWISIWFMIFLAWRIDKISSYLLIPYLVWVSFAGVLNWLSI